MAQREIHRLTARKVETLKAPGVYLDGEGLRLLVDPNGSKRWRLRFRFDGKDREMGLGGFHARGNEPAVTLALARDRAELAREHIRAGRNPIIEGLGERRVPTFGEAADRLIDSLGPQWRNAKHRAQWAMTLRDYAGPIRETKVDAIDTEAVLRVLKPVWKAKPETASRLRGRIERVLDAARAKGERQGENPARWRGHLDHLLPARQRLTRGHHAAMAYPELPAFLAALREREAVAALGLEFLILTAARTGEVLGATWDEIDLAAKVWTVPAKRMKAGREHRVPLSPAALAVLDKLAALRQGDHLLPGHCKEQPLSGMAFAMLLRRMGVGVTVHGFRSTFRDWAGEASTFPREIAEQALAHTIGDATERAYRRGDALEKRRRLMEAWARYCEPHRDRMVVPIHRRAS
jgi:integrase